MKQIDRPERDGWGAVDAISVGRLPELGALTPDGPAIVASQGIEVIDLWRDRVVTRRGILVRAVGGPLPPWAEPDDVAQACILDIVMLRHPAWSSDPGGWSVPAVDCSIRLVLGEPASLASDAVWRRLPRADYIVSAKARDLDAVARCFASLGLGRSYICACWADLHEVAGRLGSRAVRGRATVVPRCGPEAGRRVRDALDAQGGTPAGVFLCQLISAADDHDRVILDVDAMATAAMEGRDTPTVLMAFPGQPRTEAVVVMFENTPG